MVAATYGHDECVKVLLDGGAQVNIQNKVIAVPDQTNNNVCCCDEETVRVVCWRGGCWSKYELIWVEGLCYVRCD